MPALVLAGSKGKMQALRGPEAAYDAVEQFVRQYERHRVNTITTLAWSMIQLICESKSAAIIQYGGLPRTYKA